MSVKVLFVCLGNICRSPTAEGVFRKLVADSGMQDQIEIDSAGTSDWHIGKAPDARTVSAAGQRNYDLSSLRARQVSLMDFESYDYILAMDEANLSDLRVMAPADYHGHLGLFLDFSDQRICTEVPDPYHGGSSGFELVLDLIENASKGLLLHIQQNR